MRNKGNKWMIVVFVAALVAALTTVTVLLLHVRRKRRALCAYNDALDYDLDDDCGCATCMADDFDDDFTEEPVGGSAAEQE